MVFVRVTRGQRSLENLRLESGPDAIAYNSRPVAVFPHFALFRAESFIPACDKDLRAPLGEAAAFTTTRDAAAGRSFRA